MKYRKLDSNGDYVFGQNEDDFLTDAPAVAQAVKTRLKLMLGEWWEQTDDGVPYLESILGQFSNEQTQAAAQYLITKCVLDTPGVQSIVETEITSGKARERTLSIRLTIQTIYGEADVEEVI